MRASALILALIFGIPCLAGAEVYKWKDTEGKVHYSDTPPATGSFKVDEIKTAKIPFSSTPAPKPAPVMPPMPAGIDNDFKALRKNPGLCYLAGQRKSLLLSGRLIVVINNGQTGFMMDEQRQTELAKAEKNIKENC